MTQETDIFRESKEIFDLGLASCDVYYMKPHSEEKMHYHDGTEIVYVLDGNSKTHQKGRIYLYRKGDSHEVVNDSSNELVLVCLTFPPESKKNTHYI